MDKYCILACYTKCFLFKQNLSLNKSVLSPFAKFVCIALYSNDLKHFVS